MSRSIVQSLSDLRAGDGGYLCVRCHCRRETTFEVGDVRGYFLARGWSDAWRDLPRRFRCMPPFGCGAKARSIAFVLGQPELPHHRMPPLLGTHIPPTKESEAMTTEPPFEGWAILEIMGHRTRPGLVREVEIAGGKMLRVDIHGEEEAVVTEFYGTTSIYSLRPVAEDVARDAAKRLGSLRPIRPLEYRERDALPAPADRHPLDDDYD